jgi:hypothetical protein
VHLLGVGPRAQGELAASGHGVDGIEDEAHENLAKRRDLPRHRSDATQVELGIDTDLAKLGLVVPARPRHLEHFLRELVEVHRRGA